jgi:glycosyltransferase involved in cell wall biosynthesis
VHILIITQYFWPETFRINDIALGLQEKGHKVTILTGLPNYPEGKMYVGYGLFNKLSESWNGIKIYRSWLVPRGRNNSWLLFLNYISFVLFASLRVLLLSGKYDRIFVYQVSPVSSIIPACLAKRRYHIPLIINVQDLWPETLASTRQGKNSFLIKWVGKLSDFLYKKADLLLLPFYSSQALLEQRGVSSSRMYYLPNSTESFYQPVARDPQFSEMFTGDTHLILTGNLGEAQGLDMIIEAAAILHPQYPGLRWILVGDGRSKVELKKHVEEKGLERIVTFPGRFPPSQIPAMIAHADASLLTLKCEPIFAITVPNRLQSYMACGKPILASIDGEAAGIIASANCGLAAPAGDMQQFISMVNQFMSAGAEERAAWGINARNYYLDHFERDQILNQLNSLLLQTV